MKVKLVQDADGASHIEPALDDDWPDLRKLEWWAAVMLADYGMPADVREVAPGQFCITIRGTAASLSGRSFHRAWATLANLGYGYVAGLRVGRGVPPTCSRCHGWHAALACSDGGYAAEAAP